MAQIITKSYTRDTFSELVSDLQSAYNWHNVNIAENGTYAIFYVTDSIYIRIEALATDSYISVKIYKGNDVSVASKGQGYICTRILKTLTAFCFAFTIQTNNTNISPATSLNNIVIGTAVNQMTGVEETALAYIVTSSSSVIGYILSSDNLTEPVLSTPLPFYNNNLGSKVTSIQNVFSKYSECIMKDVYVLSALQFQSLSFNDCTLNNKKYYMNGAILLADD